MHQAGPADQPRSIVGYTLLIGIYNANGNEVAENTQIKKALALFPSSFLIRHESMWAKLPRWSGSYAAMASIAKDAEQFYHLNPRLRILYGLIYCDRGNILRGKQSLAGAIADYEKALSFGEYWYFYGQLANVFYELKNFDAALKAIDKAVSGNPLSAECYLLRAKIHHAMEYYAEVLDDTQRAQLIAATDHDVSELREWAARDLVDKGYKDYEAGLYRDAVDKYNLAYKFDGRNENVFHYRALANLELRDNAAAIADFGRAVALAPNDLKLYRKYDSVLIREQRWELIIENWTRFLLQQPDHAQAYYERSNAYFNKGDLQNAADDLQKACDRGLDSACNRYNWLQAKMKEQ